MQQLENSVMVRVCIVSIKIIRFFKIDDAIKINAENYYKLLDKAFLSGTGHNQRTLS